MSNTGERHPINICCARGEVLSGGCRANSSAYDILVDVADKNDSNNTFMVNLFEYFSTNIFKPCALLTDLDPESFPDEKWTLFTNGDVTVRDEIWNASSYCFSPRYKTNSTEIGVSFLYCFDPSDNIKYQILPIGMLLSIPFFIATFLVYALLPELRNVHGKSLMSYLAGLTVGYSVLSFVQLKGDNFIEPFLCKLLGATIYASFMSAFFWLNVISFDLWWNFRGVKGISKLGDRKKFAIYSAYAWGSSIFMITLVMLLDASPLISSDWKPGFGTSGCFLQNEKITQFLYLYLPVIIIICLNSIFFILTAWKIRRVQMEMTKIVAKEDSRRHQTHLDNEKAKFGLFLRLFIIMGIAWTMEPLSWAIDPHGVAFYLSDICNALQGVAIFFLFVIKPKVKKLMIKR